MSDYLNQFSRDMLPALEQEMRAVLQKRTQHASRIHSMA